MPCSIQFPRRVFPAAKICPGGARWRWGIQHIREQFVERIFRLRMLGLATGSFCVGDVLFVNKAHVLIWVLLGIHGFVWPFIARHIALRSDLPRRAEIRNLLIDSGLGGVWIALIQFNLLPSVLLVVMLGMDKLCVGGWRLLVRALTIQAVCCLTAGVLTGFPVLPATNMLEVLTSLPLLIGYPIGIGNATYRLARMVVRQNRRLAELTRIDAWSGLFNRMAWEELAVTELRRHQRSGVPAALLMIDIDHFKVVNDLHGHQTGDDAIRNVAAIIRRCTRERHSDAAIFHASRRCNWPYDEPRLFDA